MLFLQSILGFSFGSLDLFGFWVVGSDTEVEENVWLLSACSNEVRCQKILL